MRLHLKKNKRLLLTENRGKFCMKLMFIILYSSDLSLAAGQLFQITPLSSRQGERRGSLES